MKIRQIFLLACIVLLFIFFLNTPVNGLADKPALLEVEQLIKRAFEDHSWLFLESENDVRAYCESIYCEDIADKATKRIIDYKSSNSDWHSLVLVQDIDVVQSCFKNADTGTDLLHGFEF